MRIQNRTAGKRGNGDASKAPANPVHPLASLDHNYVWHPFTQMRDWLKQEPIVIIGGKGAVLQDAYGRKYLDANSSIWTNLHGHNHPRINFAVRKQLAHIAHSSALGLANEPASLLAEALVKAANPASLLHEGRHSRRKGARPLQSPLAKVFFSDNGSTALEVALKLAFEFSRRAGHSKHPRFLSMEGGYHGDTVGAVSLGHIDLFHKAYSSLLFKTDEVMAPYCYRCPFNRASPERQDAREYRKCHWECVGQVEKKFSTQKRQGNPYAGFVFEPLMQGAAGMVPQPAGWLKQVCEMARSHGALLIADEVMTGFGRTGAGAKKETPLLFASHHESVQPDFLALAKGLSGGYVPMAATLTTQSVFDAFLGEYEEFKTFFHGHSFTNSLNYYLSALFFNAFPIPQREPGALATLRYMGELANDKWCVLIFPEGRMTRQGEIAPFQPGVGMIAAKLGIPVVPIRIEGLDRVLHQTWRMARMGRVRMAFGAPLHLKGDDYLALAKQVEDAVRAL